MQFRSTLAATAVVFACLGSMAAPHAVMAATLTAGSSASAASANFVVNGKSGKLAPQAQAAGAGSKAYSSTVSKPSLKASQAFDVLTLNATINKVEDIAASPGLKAGTVAPTASVSLGALSGTITSPLGTALTVSASNIASGATLTKTASKTTPVGSAALTKLSIVSSVFGINKSYTGSPKPNFVLYQSADKTVTVYLNRQITKTTGGKVTSIAVSAVDLHVVNFMYSRQTVSGDFYLATSSAD